jgi:competence protein ComEC
MYFNLFVIIIIFLITYFYTDAFYNTTSSLNLEKEFKNNDVITVIGKIYKIEDKENTVALYIKHSHTKYYDNISNLNFIVYEKKNNDLNTSNILYSIGNTISVTGEISYFLTDRNPGNFNQYHYYKTKKIDAAIFPEKIQIQNYHKNLFLNTLNSFRNSSLKNIDSFLSSRNSGLLKGIILGDKSNIEDNTKDLYKINGISHILAISGLHLSFIGLGLYGFLRKFSKSFLLCGSISIIFMLTYIAIIGLSISSLRALSMFIFHIIGDITGRKVHTCTSITTSIVILLLWQPLSLLNSSFYLSYGAVITIIYLIPLFSKITNLFRNNIPNILLTTYRSLITCFLIQILMLPIVLSIFYTYSLTSFLLNLIIIPLMPLLLLFGILGIVFSFYIPIVSKLFFFICNILLNLFNILCKLNLKLPFSQIVSGKPNIIQIVIFILLMMASLLLFQKIKKLDMEENLITKAQISNLKNMKRKNLIFFFYGLIIAFLGIFIISFPFSKYTKELRITFLDVDQGDCIVINTPTHHTFLIDGGSSGVKNVGKYRIEPFLLSKGINEIDYVFLTHGDIDHLNGIEEFLSQKDNQIKIKNIVLAPELFHDKNLEKISYLGRKKKIPILEMDCLDNILDKEVSITSVYPNKETDTNVKIGNESSLVLYLKYKDFDGLFTGDIGKEVEPNVVSELKKEYPKNNLDILKLAHHGSKNSSSKEFLMVTKPSYSIVSAGIDNMYGHPSKETINRVKLINSKIFSTIENGAITIETNGKNIKISTHLK